MGFSRSHLARFGGKPSLPTCPQMQRLRLGAQVLSMIVVDCLCGGEVKVTNHLMLDSRVQDTRSCQWMSVVLSLNIISKAHLSRHSGRRSTRCKDTVQACTRCEKQQACYEHAKHFPTRSHGWLRCCKQHFILAMETSDCAHLHDQSFNSAGSIYANRKAHRTSLG